MMFLLPTNIANKMRLRPQEGETLDVRWMRLDSDMSHMFSDHGKYAYLAKDFLNITCSTDRLIFLDQELKFRSHVVSVLLFLSILVSCAAYLAAHLAEDPEWLSLE